MKTALKILTLALLLAPSAAFAAFPVGFSGTTTPWNGFIIPNPVNGVAPGIYVGSTTATSTFMGNLNVIGNIQGGTIITPAYVFASGNAQIGGVVLTADGSVGAPAYSFTADTNTGMYRAGTDILRFSTAGADRLTITDAGNVGIGETSPGSVLHAVQSNDGGSTQIILDNSAGTGSTDETATLRFRQAGQSAALIVNGRESDFSSAANRDGFLAFHTSLNGSTAEYMRITAAGNVGIGTTSPSRVLSVQGNGLFSGNISAANLVATGTLSVGGSISMDNLWVTSVPSLGGGFIGSSDGTGGSYPFDSYGNLILTSRSNGTGRDIVFQTGSTLATRMVIGSTGNVAIGTTTPGTRLSIGNTGANTINISETATSTFGSGIDVRTGCFAVNGVCVGGSSGAATTFSFSTTSQQNLGTTTADFAALIPAGVTHLHVSFHASSSVPAGNNIIPCVYFNTYTGATEYAWSTQYIEQADTGSNQSTADDVACFVPDGNTSAFFIELDIFNIDGIWKYGNGFAWRDFTTAGTGGGSSGQITTNAFSRANTERITSISFTTSSAIGRFPTTTIMTVHGW